ncbi:hypothetical protein [Pseudoteredinibacter isoporae]|uniref:Uncharacterized protein n=1 Tax=Pseudoteredinibacter isoporae TaxID=570281 RepID=A0A7X0JTY4_9GAMM|nr:hypothetical protein [Pseudoteredinibacter isoporae]MBB6521774.1 hypothetical protein [Pseudoteredinibacter isoporae]NHO87321.1 hypothetical protein [Pseudoteredinibacter isoporae]NIB23047.1 hypothetical protein [Pseudoteredinibacter isoporae]
MRIVISLVLAIMFLIADEANAQSKASEIFGNMKSLAGTWAVEGKEESNFRIDFELISNETVLVETWRRGSKKHSMTMYHLDGDTLLATHYCPQGNQPRLQLSKTSTAQLLSFDFLDATNLPSMDNSHQHSLGFELDKTFNKLLRKESYLSKSGEKYDALHLIRKS